MKIFKFPEFKQLPITCLGAVSYESKVFPGLTLLPSFISFNHDRDLQMLVYVVNAYEDDSRITHG
jgi:hypothetical protein